MSIAAEQHGALPKQVLVLAGPTGSGKTGAALHLAGLLSARGRSCVVINADSRQIYADFPIITAQPNSQERSVCPHLLYGYLESEQKSTAWDWALKAKTEVETALTDGKLPILVGGTGMYLRALLDGMADIPQIDPAISERLKEACDKLGPKQFYAQVQQVDPQYAAKIHPNDKQRIVRALEVWEGTGRNLSEWHRNNEAAPPWDLLRLGIGLPLPELEPFLGQRIDQMLEAGALAEAQAALLKCPDSSAPGWSGIGCAELAAYLKKEISWTECRERWQKNTRAYAKRQWTWFRADKRITWLRPEDKAELEKLCLNWLASPARP